MKYVCYGLGLAFLYMALLFLTLPVAAQYPYPDPPATYYGQIQASDTFTPATGMNITAWISGTQCGSAETQGDGAHIVYVLHVEADWDAAPGCGAPDREVHFQVGAQPMQPVVLWNNSQLHEVDLSLADVEPPQLTAVTPLDGAVDVFRNQPIYVVFNEAMDSDTTMTHITPTLSLTRTWSNGDTRLTLDHHAFSAGTRYTTTVMGSDLTGNPMVAPYTWSFTTSTESAPEADLSLGKAREGSGIIIAGDTITYTFTVTNTGPTSPVTATIVDTFDNTSALSAVHGQGCVWPGAQTVTCTVTNVISSTPSVRVLTITTAGTYSGTLYNSAVILPVGEVIDPNAGNDNAGPISVRIKRDPGDVTPPTVSSVSPSNGAVNVVRNALIVVDFSEAMQISSVSVLITPTVTGILTTWSQGDTRMTLNHDDFAANTYYTVTVMGSDVAGNPMATPYTWTFTTGTEFAPEADLALGKVREGDGVVTAGETITYTFTITNHGPTSPVSATVVDVFSDARALAGVSGSGCVWPGAETVACTVTGVATGTPSVLTMLVTTSETYSGTLSNSASVMLVGDVVDPDTRNNNAGPVAVAVWTEAGGGRVIYLPLVLRGF